MGVGIGIRMFKVWCDGWQKCTPLVGYLFATPLSVKWAAALVPLRFRWILCW
jgi:hypothetical protein